VNPREEPAQRDEGSGSNDPGCHFRKLSSPAVNCLYVALERAVQRPS
jgi:hypothetical protein